MKRRTVSSIVMAIGFLLAACAPAAAPQMKEVQMLDNGLAEGFVTFEHVLGTPDGDIVIETQYSTEYNTAEWHVTTPKVIDIKVRVKSAPVGKTVYVENMHADIALLCEHEAMNGWKTDTMDDRLHTGVYPGFLISTSYTYNESFAAEGYSQTLIEGWGFYTSTYGTSSLSEMPLTESNLIKELHVKGQLLTFVYDILVQSEGDPGPHKHVFYDEFGVPVSDIGLNPQPTPVATTAE